MPSKPSGRSVTVQNYVIIFMDALGQSQKFAEMIAPPWTDAQRPFQMELLKKTVGTVVPIRESFRESFAALGARKPRWAGLSKELEAVAEDFMQFDVCFWGVSDSFIIAVPLGMVKESCRPVSGIYRTLMSAASMMAGALAGGIALRGGVDLGAGVDIEPGEVYGPALERAYRLESRVAEYPRIVIGDELVEYIESTARGPRDTPTRALAAGMAEAAAGLITRDTDGRWVLDYFGKGIESIGVDFVNECITAAYAFALKSREESVARSDEKLAARWTRLVSYLEQRLAIWDSAKQ